MQLERPQGARWQQGWRRRPKALPRVEGIAPGGASWSQGCQQAKSETPIPGALLQMEASCPGKWNYR